MTDHHIGEAADILHVTTRTLRHWDQIGLLVPTRRTWSDHRLYTDDDLERALQILVYRAAGLPLREIRELLDAPVDAAATLRRQREILVDRIGHLHRMVRAVDELLEGGDTMSIKDKADLFRDEAEERWGGTPEWEQSQATQSKMTDQDWESVKREQDEFVALLADAADRRVEPGSAEAAAIVEKHRASIGRFYAVSREKQVLLARMYTQDQRFDATYRGHSAYLLALIEAQAEEEGVDPADVQWR